MGDEAAKTPAPAAPRVFLDLAPPTDGPSLPYRLRRYLHTLPFLSPIPLVVFALLFLASLHIAALALFTRGFLLNRQALTNINDCVPLSPSLPGSPHNDDISRLDASCTLPSTHSKVIFLVVDALRADFVFPVDSTFANPFHHNHITLPSSLSSSTPTHSFLTHFIADAPTTTLQRLKGLTTGSLPTFVDAGSNFAAAGERVTEDTWLSQAKRFGKRIKLVGDDTWLGVFPAGETSEEFIWGVEDVKPFDSFNVEDLDTVDHGVRLHLLKLMDEKKQGNDEWDIIVAHGLGLDHAGHRFGALHSETTRKLKETQFLLEDVVERLEEDTLLVVLGDHGMTDRGDHGGDTRDEVDAALWVYSKGAALTSAKWYTHPLSSPRHPLSSLFNTSSTCRELGDQMLLLKPQPDSPTRSISQVDLVPTLSLLLGLPIPFGSLGLPIPELFFRETSLPSSLPPSAKPPPPRSLFGLKPSTPPSSHQSLSALQTLLQAHLLVASQLSHYLNIYTSSPSGADLKPALPELHFILGLAKSTYRGACAPGANQSAMELKALQQFWRYERRAREHARNIWAKFDKNLIAAGLIVWIGSVLVSLRLITATRNGSGARYLIGQGVEGVVVTGWALLGLWLLSAFEIVGGLKPLWVVFLIAIGAELGVLFSPLTPTSRFGSYGLGGKPSTYLSSLLPLIAHSALFASNSFVVFEDSSVLFILSTLLVIGLIKALSAPEARLRKRLIALSIAALVFVRLMAYSTICRDEQAPHCHVTFHLDPSSTKAWIVVGVALVAAWRLPSLIRTALRVSASDVGIAPPYLDLAIRIFLLIAVGYWGVDQMIGGLGLSPESTIVAKMVKTGFAKVVLVGTVLSATLVWYNCPLCLRVQRETVRDEAGNDVRTQVKFIGFANAFGSTYLLFFSTIFALIFLVNPPPGQLVLTLHFLTLLCLSEIFDSERDVEHLRKSVTSASIADLLNNDLPAPPSHTGPNFRQISLIALLSHLSFFATGHQAALSTIQWSTAFIGFPTLVYPFSPILVILNTLGSHILGALSIPLFVFWALSPTLRDQPPIFVARNLLRSALAFSTYQTVVALSAAVFSAWFRRHLMVWKVFAPRFMVGAVTLLATDFTLVVLALGWGAWVTVKKVKGTLGTRLAE